jgi:hypothetical protein
MGQLGGAREESGNVTDDTNRLGRGGDARIEGRLGGNVLYLEQRFAPTGVGVVVVGDNATAEDSRYGEEEDAAIIVVEGNNAMGPLSLSPLPLISIPQTMSALSYSPMVPLLRPFKLGVGGGINKTTLKEGESNRACLAISFFWKRGVLSRRRLIAPLPFLFDRHYPQGLNRFAVVVIFLLFYLPPPLSQKWLPTQPPWYPCPS